MSISLKKAVIEIRFPEQLDTLKHMSDFNELSKTINKDFPTSNFDFNNSSFVLQNPSLNQSCIISQFNIVISQELASNIDIFNKLIERTLESVREKQILQNISRVGYRTFWGIDFESMEGVDNALCNGFKIDRSSFNCFGDTSNVKFGFSTKESDYGFNYNFTPAINKEFKLSNGLIFSETETFCLLNDIDIFIEQNCKYSNLFKYITDFRNLTKEKSLLIDQIVEGGRVCL